MTEKALKPVARTPRKVFDDSGDLVEVILDYGDYRDLLQKLAQETDWETLPPHLQDLVDGLLMDDAAAEEGENVPLAEVVRESSEPSGG